MRQNTREEQPESEGLRTDHDLLAEWTESRRAAHRLRAHTTGFVAVLSVVALLVLPALWKLEQGLATRAAVARCQASVAARRRSELEARLKNGAPLADARALKGTLAFGCRSFFDELAEVVNARSPSMAFRNVKAEVLDGTIKIRCQADADSAATAHMFAESAGRRDAGSSLVSALRQNSEMGPRGVSFEYVKSARVTP